MHSLWSAYRDWYQRQWLRVCFRKIDLSDRTHQAIAAGACHRIASSTWYSVFLLAVCLLSMVLSSAVMTLLFSILGWPWTAVAWFALLFPIAAMLNVALLWTLRGLCRRTVRSAVIELGADICLRCGHLLVDQDRCPECGKAVPR